MNEKIKVAALEVFERFPEAKEVFVTSDEQAFLKEDRARMHDKDFVTVKRSDVIADEKQEKLVKKTAAELIEFISTVETLDELEALSKDETRVTVIAAIDARKLELTPKKD